MLFRGLQEKNSHFPHHPISLDFLLVVSGSWDVLNLHQGCKCRLNYKHKIRVCSPLISLANCYAPPLTIWCERQLALPKMKFLHCRHEIVRALDFKIGCFRYLISKQLSAVLSIKANGTIKLCIYVTEEVYLQYVGATGEGDTENLDRQERAWDDSVLLSSKKKEKKKTPGNCVLGGYKF